MRVLMLTDLYPPFIGGLEQHVRNLSHGLVERGHQVSVGTMSHEGLPCQELDGGVQVHRIRGTAQRMAEITNPSGRPYAAPLPDPGAVVALRRLIDRERPDIVHAHNWLLHSFLPLKRWSRAKLVVSLHDYGVICAKRSLMYGDEICSGPAFAKCLRCAASHYGTGRGLIITLANWATQPAQWSSVDLYLPVSNAVVEGNELQERALPFQVLPNFVPNDIVSRVDPAYPALAALPTEPYLLFVGALSRHKGIDVLLRAYEGLRGVPPLVLIGTASRETPERLPKNTVVIPNLPHGAVMAAWQRSTLAVVPSVFPDPCPTVAMEAMASGVPIVASRVGGLPDLVLDGVTGLLVAPGSPEELGDAIERLVREPATAVRMGKAGKRHLRQFLASTVLDRLEGIYAGLLASSS